MSQLSVSEAAHRLGVSARRVHERIQDGSLAAEKVGGRWLVSDLDVVELRHRTRPGRPLSERSAWALLAAAGDGRLLKEGFAAPERSRARARLRALRSAADLADPDEITVLLGHALRRRSERRLFVASPRDLDGVRGDARVTVSGLNHPGSTLSAADIAEGYVRADDLSDVVDVHLLSPAPRLRANVVLHLLSPAAGPFASDLVMTSDLLYAADLAEHPGVRERNEALEAARRVPLWSEATLAEGGARGD
jgi:excisionase family DNA binding protein